VMTVTLSASRKRAESAGSRARFWAVAGSRGHERGCFSGDRRAGTFRHVVVRQRPTYRMLRPTPVGHGGPTQDGGSLTTPWRGQRSTIFSSPRGPIPISRNVGRPRRASASLAAPAPRMRRAPRRADSLRVPLGRPQPAQRHTAASGDLFPSAMRHGRFHYLPDLAWWSSCRRRARLESV